MKEKIDQNGPARHFHHAPAAPAVPPSRPTHRAVPKSAAIPSIGCIVQVSLPRLPDEQVASISASQAPLRAKTHLPVRCAPKFGRRCGRDSWLNAAAKGGSNLSHSASTDLIGRLNEKLCSVNKYLFLTNYFPCLYP